MATFVQWGGVAPTLMAGTHGYGFGYFLEIKELSKDEVEAIKNNKRNRRHTI